LVCSMRKGRLHIDEPKSPPDLGRKNNPKRKNTQQKTEPTASNRVFERARKKAMAGDLGNRNVKVANWTGGTTVIIEKGVSPILAKPVVEGGGTDRNPE